MPQGQRTHLYCLCWNDARMLPFFFRHYDELVDQYFVYDNGSTDDSLAILQSHPRVEVAHFETKDSFVDMERRLSDTIWLPSRGVADWVFMVDIDEHVYHPNLLNYLRRCTVAGVTAIRAIGYEMVSDRFPQEGSRLSEVVTLGMRSLGFDKLCLFNPHAIEETRYAPGRHSDAATGRVVLPDPREVLMLHYKQLGVDYPIVRSAELRQGLRSGDFEKNWGWHYTMSADKIATNWARIRANSATVPALDSQRSIGPEDYDEEERAVGRSGLFDRDCYLQAYPDLHATRANPLSHFCVFGWREGRKPNLYFDPKWYRDYCPQARAPGQNPLLHYLNVGEPQGFKPSPLFDPAWYRERHGLAAADSPLRDYLLRRKSALVSPLSDFDVTAYCREHPEVMRQNRDPYEDYYERRRAEGLRIGADATLPLPAFRDVAIQLGLDADSQSSVEQTDSAAIIETLKRFLEAVPLDEQWYCEVNPDVAAAIRDGKLASAREHFVDFGWFEGRAPS
jgi:hypothetical protein